MYLKSFLFLFFIALYSLSLKGDSTFKTKFLLPCLTFKPTIPQGALNARYPYFTTATLGMHFINAKNWMFGIDGGVLFGGADLDSNHFNGIARNSKLIDANGNPALVRTQARGYVGMATIGKLIPIHKKNRFSGILVTAGLGFIQHKIKMQFDSYTVPQLQEDYLLGYDKLHNGLLTSIGVKYIVISKGGLSFMTGLDYGLSFTKSRRSWEYSQNMADLKLKKNHLPSLNVSLFVPIELHTKKQISYFE